MNYRRAELVDLNGLLVRTFLDDSGEVVMVDVRDILEKIGISRKEEGERLFENPEIINRCSLVMDFCYYEGIRQSSLFVPLSKLNDYLYSIEDPSRPDVMGNLQEFRSWLAIEVNRHWSRLRGSPSSLDSLDVRSLMLRESFYELSVSTKGLDL